jgi:hypothetical protein
MIRFLRSNWKSWVVLVGDFLEPSMIFGIDGTMAGRRVLELVQFGFVEPVGFAVDWVIDVIDGRINPIDETGWVGIKFHGHNYSRKYSHDYCFLLHGFNMRLSW